MSYKKEWESFGRKDPYYGVLANPRYHHDRLNKESLDVFYKSGVDHLDTLFRKIDSRVKQKMKAGHVLDFGCGVGRILIPLSRRFKHATGIDVSASMLDRAKDHCVSANARNVDFLTTEDWLKNNATLYDFIHSIIVFQHIPPSEGLLLFKTLCDRLAPGGVAAVHFTFAWRIPAARKLAHQLQGRIPFVHAIVNLLKGRPLRYPFMQMFHYNKKDVLKVSREKNLVLLGTDPMDHGGHIGEMLIFQK